MRARLVALSVGVLCALGGDVALAQSAAATATPVTPVVTVVAKREPVVTVLAPRVSASEAPVVRRHPTQARIGKAVDADGDGLADAPSAAGRSIVTTRSSQPRTASVPVKSAAASPDCGERKADSASKTTCAKANPVYADKAPRGRNPLHEP